jgi:hypothetical protein
MLDFNSAPRQDEFRHNEIDADDICDRLNAAVESFIGWLFDGRALIKGGEARIGNIQGEQGASLCIALTGPKVGQWYDFSTKDKGNLIGLYRQHRGFAGTSDFDLSLREIAKYFLHDDIEVERQTWRQTPTEQIKETSRKFGNKPIEDMVLLGAPVRTFKYFDVNRNIMAIVRRYEPDGIRNNKTFRPHCFKMANDGKLRWVAGMPDPRPLYRLPEIAQASSIVLTEGEGKADALAELGIVATSIMGGANAVEKTEWSPLTGKTVTIWPDNDQSGQDFARDATAALVALGCKVKLVPIPAGKTEGWDAVDCIAEGGDAAALIDSAMEVTGSANNTGPTGRSGTNSGTAPPPPVEIEETLKVFDKWLALPDQTPILAALGTVAANLLPGDPVWLGLIGPPSSAKTEILNSTSVLNNIAQAATMTVAGLLSGSPKKSHAKGAQGGLLRQIGDFGIIVLKDFGSILSMHPETKAEVLAALREIYDGAWTRHLGSDGGRTLSWKGKVGLLFAATGVIDSHYSVIGSMGDRFLLSRLAPVGHGQFNRAMKHVGAGTKQMREELSQTVTRLFAGLKAEPRTITQEEIQRIDDTIMLVVRLRGAVARDRQSREIEAVYGAEGTARIGLTLERLLAGLDMLGVDRATAMDVVVSVALDSVPPARRKAYDYLHGLNGMTTDTTAIAKAMALPTVTVRRVLEELVAYGLVTRDPQGQGKPDLWRWIKF